MIMLYGFDCFLIVIKYMFVNPIFTLHITNVHIYLHYH